MLLILVIAYAFQQVLNTDAAPLPYTLTREASVTSPLPQLGESNNRSVWDIISSCLVIAFTCSWVSMHPNIPPKDESLFKKVLRRLELMFWSILAPELIITWAMRQWVGARKLKKTYREYKWTKTHGYFIQMGGFMLYSGANPVGVLTPELLAELLHAKSIEMPPITEDEINDRSKADGLAKALVILHTTWFILQTIARPIQGLTITPLELATFALAVLNGIMYFLWWNKPLRVECAVPVQYILQTKPTNGAPMPKEAVVDGRFQIFQWILGLPVAGVLGLVNRMVDMVGCPESHGTFAAYKYPNIYPPLAVLICVGGLFGGIHCAGWNLVFPTIIEAKLWRISSSIVAGLPVAAVGIGLITFIITAVYLVSAFCNAICEDEDSDSSDRAMTVMITVGVSLFYSFSFCYTLGRLTLLVGAFISLRDVPISALAPIEWTKFIPHVTL